MDAQAQLAQLLGISDRTPEEQADLIDLYQVRVGEALLEQATDEQAAEYRAIINEDRDFIQAWLDTNIPDYREHEIFEATVENASEEDEQIWPEKTYAALMWVSMNFPDYGETARRVAEEFADDLVQDASS